MENFILENDTWLRYLPIAIYALIIAIVVMLILIGFLLLKRYKNKSLQSQRHKSAFAAAYDDCFVPNAASSLPLKRNEILEQDMHFTHINPAAPIPDRPKPPSFVYYKESSRLSETEKSKVFNSSKVLDFYFEFEDEYKI